MLHADRAGNVPLTCAGKAAVQGHTPCHTLQAEAADMCFAVTCHINRLQFLYLRL